MRKELRIVRDERGVLDERLARALEVVQALGGRGVENERSRVNRITCGRPLQREPGELDLARL